METVDGLSHVFAINVLAPYLLTALMTRPSRLVYMSSSMHHGGDPAMDDLQWRERQWSGAQAYSDSKLFDLVLACAVARRWSDVLATTWPSVGTLRRPTNVTSRTRCWAPAGS